MVPLAIFLISVYGLANAIAELKAGKAAVHAPLQFMCNLTGSTVWSLPFRFLRELVKCPPCISFWVGIAASLLVFSPSIGVCGGVAWKAAIVDGLAACGTSWIIHVATTKMGHGLEEL